MYRISASNGGSAIFLRSREVFLVKHQFFLEIITFFTQQPQ